MTILIGLDKIDSSRKQFCKKMLFNTDGEFLGTIHGLREKYNKNYRPQRTYAITSCTVIREIHTRNPNLLMEEMLKNCRFTGILVQQTPENFVTFSSVVFPVLCVDNFIIAKRKKKRYTVSFTKEIDISLFELECGYGQCGVSCYFRIAQPDTETLEWMLGYEKYLTPDERKTL